MGVAIGLAGIPALLDFRGKPDLFGREMRVSVQGYGDLIASVGQLVSGEGAEGRPIALIRGLQFPAESGTARDLLRPAEQDLYR
jgi:coenzyme F420-0:L-glutamate ligase/coenzyme F420-1:gamma-L-glutamate ligase